MLRVFFTKCHISRNENTGMSGMVDLHALLHHLYIQIISPNKNVDIKRIGNEILHQSSMLLTDIMDSKSDLKLNSKFDGSGFSLSIVECIQTWS